jgi:hypothetical protein
MLTFTIGEMIAIGSVVVGVASIHFRLNFLFSLREIDLKQSEKDFEDNKKAHDLIHDRIGVANDNLRNLELEHTRCCGNNQHVTGQHQAFHKVPTS